MKKLAIILMGLLLGAMAPVHAAVETDAQAPDFTLTDTTGKTHSLSDYKGKYVVLEWINFECPFVQKHYNSNNMQSIQKNLAGQDVVWLSINSSAEGKQGYYEPSEINRKIEELGAAPTAYLLDTDGNVGRTYGAKTTPHMYIINPEGTLVYQGAIDDNPSFDPSVIPTSTNYITAAFNQLTKGQAVEQASTKSYGCSVKY